MATLIEKRKEWEFGSVEQIPIFLSPTTIHMLIKFDDDVWQLLRYFQVGFQKISWDVSLDYEGDLMGCLGTLSEDSITRNKDIAGVLGNCN